MFTVRRLAKDLGGVFIKARPGIQASWARASVKTRFLATTANPADLIGYDLPDKVVKYTERDVLLYNLGVGASLSSGHTDVLRYLYENNQGFSVVPSFGTTFLNGFLEVSYAGKFPLPLDFSKLFHGEHFIEVKKALNPKGGTLTTKSKISDVVDKGKGSVLVVDVDTFGEDGSLVVRNQAVVYTQQYKGWGGKKNSDLIIQTVPTPDRAADVTVTEKTSVDQAALYRLSGDMNPFHIDPMMAAIAGFPRPILHGLCTYGFSTRHIIDKICGNETQKFKSSKLRFSTPVLPGQTIQTDMWKEGSRVHFTTTVADTGTICISGAYIDLVE